MEIRTAGNALLPTLCRSFSRQHTTLGHASPFTRTLLSTRQYSATPVRRQPEKPSFEDVSAAKPASASASTTPAQPTDFSSLIDRALDFTKASPNTSQGRTSHYESSRLPASRKSSLDDLSAGFASRGRSSGGGFDMASMLDPANRSGALSPPSRTPQQTIMPQALPAYGPSVGRTVEVNVNRGMDVGRAFRSLEINCARNKVRADFQRQRFHERGGLKRKRLRSERWRRRFREGFRGMVKLVSGMKKQGW